ncbi:MAG TPA: hypothetical protein VK616_05400, partial [Flavitalea sp.]|nr:hypothetical protein [Flavitalea sp.]
MKVKNFLCWGSVLLSVIAFSGCIKDTPIEPPKPVSFVSLLNISFKAPPVEMLINNEKATAPINPGVYFTRYITMDPGMIDVTFKKAGSD